MLDCGENDLMNSSLLVEASQDYGMAYLEFCIENFKFKKVKTSTTVTFDFNLGSVKSFIFNPIIIYPENVENACMDSNFYSTREIEQVLFISGPEKDLKASTERCY